MILKTLHVQNFRQVAGSYRIAFGAPGPRNVTIILGDNGSGKSTVLNAFRWCLYGKTEMENPEELLSHYAVYKAAVGEHVRVEVDLTFEHGGATFSVLRLREYTKLDGGEVEPVGEEVFRVTRVAANGVPKTLDEPAGFVLNLLPENLSKFFFFQGESILQLALQRSREELREGVETFLDFKVLDRAIYHLKNIESEFERDLRKIAGSDVQEIQEKIDSLRQDIEATETELAQILANVAANKEDTADARRRLAEVDQFRPLLVEIGKQEARLAELENQRSQTVATLCEAVSADGYLAFAGRELAEPTRLADAAVEKGELPAKIKPQFVADLIERGICICCRTIDDPARAALEQWRSKTGLAELEEAIASLRRSVFVYENDRRSKFLARLPLLRDQLAEIDEQTRQSIEKKSSAEREVGNVSLDEAEIWQLQESYERLKNEFTELRVRETQLTDVIRESSKRLNELETARNALTKKKKQEDVFGRRIAAAGNVRKALEQVRADWSGFVQEYLDQQVKTAWAEVAQLPRRVSFNPDFTLSIEERGGTGDWVTSAPSEANCAVLALTFVSALVRFAREVGQDRDRQGFFTGGDYPLVMDAPFAKMDIDFKEKVPRGLARTVPQIVVISSLDQWNGEVDDGLRAAVGKAYVLTLHKPGEEPSIRQVDAFGRKIDYVVTDHLDLTDWSEIQEVLP